MNVLQRHRARQGHFGGSDHRVINEERVEIDLNRRGELGVFAGRVDVGESKQNLTVPSDTERE